MRLVQFVLFYFMGTSAAANPISESYQFMKSVNSPHDMMNSSYDIKSDLYVKGMTIKELIKLDMSELKSQKETFGEDFAFRDKSTKLELMLSGCVGDEGYISYIAKGLKLKDYEPENICEKGAYLYAKIVQFSC